jgi:hypothetical protein
MLYGDAFTIKITFKNIIACIFNLCFLIMGMSPDIPWNDTTKKDARGSNDKDLGRYKM